MKTALVTGASSGIGKEIYYFMKEFGYTTIGISRNGPDISMDLVEHSNRWDLYNELIVGHGISTISCLVNCAGVLELGEDDPTATPADLEYIMGLNFWAPYHLCRMFAPTLKSNKGSIINISSISGMMADPDTVVYGASKAALLSMTKSLAVKLAPDVRVNAISPGFFDTNLVPEPTPKYMIDPVPLGFEAQTHMIIPVVRALLESEYVTGSNYVVDGGLSCKVK